MSMIPLPKQELMALPVTLGRWLNAVDRSLRRQDILADVAPVSTPAPVDLATALVRIDELSTKLDQVLSALRDTPVSTGG